MNNLTAPNNNLDPVTGKPKKSRLKWLAWIIVLAVLATGAYYLLAKRDAQPAEGAATGTSRRGPGGAGGPSGMNRPMPIVAATVRTGDINVYLNGLGSATPLNSVIVKTQVNGQLISVKFREGQLVKRGDLLAEVDPRPYQVQLTQAEGQMARDQALLKNAQIDLERYRTLFEQDSIARQQLDTQASLVRQYEGAVKVDQGQIDAAKLQLTYSRITAPISGRVGLRQVDPGNIVSTADVNGVVVITQLQPINVVFTLPEDNIPALMKKLQAGQKLPVDAYDRAQQNKLASGTLTTIDNQIDATTGTVKLKAQFANDDYSMFANQFVNTRLLLEIKHGVMIAPTAGIQRGNQGTFVYIVNADRTVSVRNVVIGTVQGDNTEIVSGLKSGDIIVVDGADKLREGAKVDLASLDGKHVGPRGSGAAGANGANGQNGEHRKGEGRRRHQGEGSSDASVTSTDKPQPGANPQNAPKEATPANPK